METAERIEAIRTRLGEIQIDERRAQTAGPPCTECIFAPIDGTDGPCDHIAHWNRRFDPIDGKWRGSLRVTVAEARSEDGLCGPEGLLFHPYSLKGRAARWLAKNGPWPLWFGFIGLASAGAIFVDAIN